MVSRVGKYEGRHIRWCFRMVALAQFLDRAGVKSVRRVSGSQAQDGETQLSGFRRDRHF